MPRRLVVVVLFVALFAAACTSEGLPSDYGDQDARAEVQFVEACEAALDDSGQADVPEYCQCAFYTVASQLTFDEFLELDAKLKDDPESLSLEEQRLFDSVTLPCSFGAADISTTVPTG